jgi:uncharacterized protein YggE
MKVLRLVLAGAAIATVVAFAGVGLPSGASGDTPATPDRSITVSGQGSVEAVPNQTAFTFGVTTRGKAAAQALQANSVDMAKVIAALKGAGVKAADLRTSYVSLSPVTSEDGQTITGYSASNSVSATIDGIARAGEIVDVAVAAGANTVDGPALSIDDQDALYRSALKAAVADARKKADTLAEASGLQVGAVRSVIEGSSAPSPVPYTDAKAPAASTPIEPGMQEVMATVTVVFDVS